MVGVCVLNGLLCVCFVQLDILVRGYSGYNTRWALKVLERVFPPQEKEAPVAIIVFFGANDAALPDRTSAYQHVPLDEYRHNLHSIVSYFKVLFVLRREPYMYLGSQGYTSYICSCKGLN